MEFFSFINIAGTIAFTASGTLAAMRKNLDIFGVLVIAFVTSVGGGTIRDMLIGHLPVRWILDSSIILLIIGVTGLTVLFRSKIDHLDKTLTFFDSLGLGFFALRGIQEGIAVQLNIPSCIILGTITACFGGVIRDILLNEIPALFRTGQLYATVCIIGGCLFFVLQQLNISDELIEITTVLFIFGIRTLAIKKNIHLPKINKM
ncbi:trimeric intracellular cation channel family protein [Emticicia sp. BO119]|uniref:trimeric intracellular cation channel family protein n=1 Tax=Emticicia sp. BO119 TaxID=2757768 RepID=UPI0015F02D53|nr:trimeric intracellular cation channel family protein [Emticicia sp. BO119]MBA4853169.1 trimeric intracellular cation channel family protein [Emticicia sp. BO119]